MPARVEIPITVINGSTGYPVVGASVTVKKRSDGSNAMWYTAEVGGGSSTGPIVTDSSGRVDAWVERGAYNLEVTGTGIAPYTEAWDAFPASDGSLDGALFADGTITAAKMAPGALTSGSRGYNYVATDELIPNGALAVLPTPDRVTGIVVPTNGLLRIAFRGLVTVQGGANIYIGGNPLTIPNTNGAPTVPTPGWSASPVGDWEWLHTTATGLVAVQSTGGAASAPTATQPMTIQPVTVEVPAGTYTVEVRMGTAVSGRAKERKLWVEAVPY